MTDICDQNTLYRCVKISKNEFLKYKKLTINPVEIEFKFILSMWF